MKKLARIIAGGGLLIGLIGLLLQFSLTIPASMAAGRNFWLSVLFYFSFFTILSNIAAVVSQAGQLFPVKELAYFRRRSTAGAITTLMMVVGIVYHFILAPLWSPKGLFLVCDVILHYVTPLLTAAWWLVSANGKARFETLLWWLVPPVVYLVFVYIRWAFVDEVPYPFLDPALPRQELIRGIVGIVVLFVITGPVVVISDKVVGWLKRQYS
jgi:hypothetical protein